MLGTLRDSIHNSYPPLDLLVDGCDGLEYTGHINDYDGELRIGRRRWWVVVAHCTADHGDILEQGGYDGDMAVIEKMTDGDNKEVEAQDLVVTGISGLRWRRSGGEGSRLREMAESW